MSPLSFIKYIVEHLQGTIYEPWINALLFLLFTAATIAALLLLLGKSGQKLFLITASTTTEKIKKRRGYAPEVEKFRARIEPYIDLLGSLCFAFVGLYSATSVGLTASSAISRAPFWTLLVCTIWILASFFYMRLNLEAASWAYHKIKTKRTV